MALLKGVQRAFERIAPTSLAGSWDNVGVLLEAASPNPQHRRVVLCIDFTRQVFDSLPADTGVVCSYHPPWFASAKSLRLDNPLQASLLGCAARGISVYSPHSSLDAANGGIDDWLADGLEAGAKRRRISPASKPPEGHQDAGSGMIVELSKPASLDTLVERLKPHLGVKNLMIARSPYGPQEIRTVALCAGSGGSVLKGAQADVVFTGELGHHEVLAFVAAGQHVILANHTNTERGYLPILRQRLQDELASEQGIVEISQADRDPLDFV